jgi:hypothetical protein
MVSPKQQSKKMTMGVVLSRSKQRRKSEELPVVLDMLCRVVAGAYLVGIVSASRLLQGRHDVYAAPLPFVREHDVAWRVHGGKQMLHNSKRLR